MGIVHYAAMRDDCTEFLRLFIEKHPKVIFSYYFPENLHKPLSFAIKHENKSAFDLLLSKERSLHRHLSYGSVQEIIEEWHDNHNRLSTLPSENGIYIIKYIIENFLNVFPKEYNKIIFLEKFINMDYSLSKSFLISLINMRGRLKADENKELPKIMPKTDDLQKLSSEIKNEKKLKDRSSTEILYDNIKILLAEIDFWSKQVTHGGIKIKIEGKTYYVPHGIAALIEKLNEIDFRIEFSDVLHEKPIDNMKLALQRFQEISHERLENPHFSFWKFSVRKDPTQALYKALASLNDLNNDEIVKSVNEKVIELINTFMPQQLHQETHRFNI